MPSKVSMTRPQAARTSSIGVICAVAATVALASAVAAHDFWIIPDLFAFSGDAAIQVSGRSGTRFPAGSAVQPARVADARVIGANSEMKITEMAAEGSSLRMHQKPSAAGQYLVAVALTPRTTRSTPAGLLRFLRAEGGASEAARLERENAFAGQDSVVFTSTSYAFTIVEVGNNGPRAFSKSAGFPLEFVPTNDPAHLHVGDTLHVKIIGGGKPVPGIGVFAGWAIDTTAASPQQRPDNSLTLSADANGVIHLPLTRAGAWNIRAAFVSRRGGGAGNEWEVARSTYVLGVSGHH